MTKKAIIVSIEKEILVHPVLSPNCATCGHTCEKASIEYAVSNPRNLEIRKGSIVELAPSSFIQGLSGILSLLLPFFCAIAGYFLSPSVASLFGTPVTDGIRAACVLSFLLISGTAVFLITRFVELPGKLTIVSID